MLETMSTIFFVGVVVAMGLVIFAYAVYTIFFPLFRTVGGGLHILKSFGEQRAKITEKDYTLIPHAQVGLTMADGGDPIDKEKTPEGDQ